MNSTIFIFWSGIAKPPLYNPERIPLKVSRPTVFVNCYEQGCNPARDVWNLSPFGKNEGFFCNEMSIQL